MLRKHMLCLAFFFIWIISFISILRQDSVLRSFRKKIEPLNSYYAVKAVEGDGNLIHEQNQTGDVLTNFAEPINIKDKNDTDLLDKIKQHRLNRSEHFDSWFTIGNNGKKDRLKTNADANGPILDFAIVGFPKTGTSTMMANLATITPMPMADVCTPVHQTVWYSYNNWPRDYGNDKILRGAKCPSLLDGGIIKQYSEFLPKTKLILGIRHPVTWFQSFWNMQASHGHVVDPMEKIHPCKKGKNKKKCKYGCPGQLFCLHRARFHLWMASMGKTQMSSDEREILASNDFDGGDNIRMKNISNDIFVYEQTDLNQDYLWDELATYLDVSSISHSKYRGAKGGSKVENMVDFCNKKYDDFRALMMPNAFDLADWLLTYFIPLAEDKSRLDVVIPNTERFRELVKDYKKDPCGRLQRMENGTYALPN